MARSGTAIPLSNREIIKLMEDWGFTVVGGNGGHTVLQYNGRRVQVSAPGRSSHTPYKAVRKAANLMGKSIKEFLAGPRKTKVESDVDTPDFMEDLVTEWVKDGIKEDPLSMEVQTLVLEEFTPSDEWVCPECGKGDFLTDRGFQAHVRAHEQVPCPVCHETFSRAGLGRHQKHCLPKRTVGRPRHPIAETLDDTRKRKGKENGIEVPDLENLEDLPFEALADVLTFKQADPEVSDETRLIASIFMPDRDLTPDTIYALEAWIEASKAAFRRGQ